MRLRTTVLLAFGLIWTSISGQINPIAAYYGDETGYPAWTDAIRWDNRINMKEFRDGENDFEKFENARDLLFQQGGGVLYYPAGTYDFSDLKGGRRGRGLMLKRGVVILGEKPAGDSVAGDGSLELPTRFVFPLRNLGTDEDPKQVPVHWNLVGIVPRFGEELKEVDHVGIAWVHLDGGLIYFGPQMTWGEDYATAGAWRSSRVFGDWKWRTPDGTFPLDPFCGAPMNTSLYEGAGKGRFVFGCIVDNATMHNDFMDDGFGEEGYFNYKFVARIGVYGSKVFIANNLLPKPARCFTYTQLTSEGEKEILYDYGFSTGIDVNKNHLNINANKLEESGGYWEPGVVIRDNWVYNHLFKGFDISGTWMSVTGNTNAHDRVVPGSDVYGTATGWTLTANGYTTHMDNGSSDAFQNRAFDVAGKAVWLDRNEYWGVGTPRPSNDGEGILCQSHGGTQMHSWALTRNYGHDDGSGYGYMMGWDVDNLGVMMAWNTTPANLGAAKVSDRQMIDVSFVDNIFLGDGELSAPCGQLSCDVLTECPEGSPLPSLDVAVDAVDEGGYVEVSWKDGSDHEIGFRVDRRMEPEGDWVTVAYRPRRNLGHADNQQVWRDYLAGSGVSYRYRVVAVNCSDGPEGAAEAQQPVILTTRVETPSAYPPSGSFTHPVRVGLSCATFGAKIRYTVDGSEPVETSPLYEDSIEITESTTLRFRAFREGAMHSYEQVENYTVEATGIRLPSSLPGGFFLYPVPVKDNLYLRFLCDPGPAARILVTDLHGRILQVRMAETPSRDGAVEIPGPFPSGIYVVRLVTREGVWTRRFIVP